MRCGDRVVDETPHAVAEGWTEVHRPNLGRSRLDLRRHKYNINFQVSTTEKRTEILCLQILIMIPLSINPLYRLRYTHNLRRKK
jgi:hypothetical protein